MLGARGATYADTDSSAFVAHQAATQTFTAELKQTFHWTFPHRHVESVGRICYQAPDRLAMLLTNPVTESVVVRGTDLYVKRDQKPLVHSTLQVRNGKPTQNVQFLLAFFQNGCTNYLGLFDAEATRSDNTLAVTLVPKHPIQMFPLRRVTNVLGLPGFDVQAMRIGLILDSYITYEFIHPVRNQPLDATVFNIPKE